METNISQVAMIHRLKVSQWGASKKDAETSNEVCDEKEAVHGAADVIVRLVPKEELKPIQREANKVKAIRDKYTLPYINDGERILPAGFYDRCTNEINEAIVKFNEAVEYFVNERYPIIIKNAESNLGKFLMNNPLPSTDVIRSKFSIMQTITPLPKADDFSVVGITNGPLEEIRRNITNAVNKATDDAVKSLYSELAKLVQKIKDTTSVKDKIFRDSLIGNLKDFCEVLPTLNITNDENLNILCKSCKDSLAQYNPQDLRDSTQLRKQVSKKADTMLQTIRKINFDID